MAIQAFTTPTPEYSPGQLLNFDWENRWLKGHEYAHILQNSEAYASNYDFRFYPAKTHPKNIYLSPISKYPD